jgi:hypothetical protein
VSSFFFNGRSTTIYSVKIIIYNGFLTFLKANALQFTVNNGNIIKAITTEGQVVKESIYTYDNQPHLEFGEFTYEMPLNSNFEYILIHDKLNLRNTNNI